MFTVFKKLPASTGKWGLHQAAVTSTRYSGELVGKGMKEFDRKGYCTEYHTPRGQRKKALFWTSEREAPGPLSEAGQAHPLARGMSVRLAKGKSNKTQVPFFLPREPSLRDNGRLLAISPFGGIQPSAGGGAVGGRTQKHHDLDRPHSLTGNDRCTGMDRASHRRSALPIDEKTCINGVRGTQRTAKELLS